jgi:hypothetical protein
MSRLQRTVIRVAAAGVLGCAFWGNAAPSQVHPQPATSPSSKRSIRPAFINTRVITKDVKRLVGFYEPVLELKAKWSGEDYAEFATGVGVLAIFSANAQEKYIPGSAEAAKKSDHYSGIQSCRCGCRIPAAEGLGENLGQAANHAAMGHTLNLFSRCGRKPRQFLRACADFVEKNPVLLVNIAPTC